MFCSSIELTQYTNELNTQNIIKQKNVMLIDTTVKIRETVQIQKMTMKEFPRQASSTEHWLAMFAALHLTDKSSHTSR